MPLTNRILKTKFYLPQPTSDFVERKLLLSKLEKLRTRPIMLVSASTGYGKSTFVANFFSHLNENYTWLTLSEKENDFTQFVAYFVTAIQIKAPDFGEEILSLLQATVLPPVEELVEIFVNDIAELDSIFYMALDDLHLIRNPDVLLFISKIFEYPQPYFRLIIITRRDPELSMVEWVNKNKLIEIRSADLKFSQDEIAEFYEKSISYRPDENVLSKLEQATDGWVSGLRMLTLSTNRTEDLEQQFSNFKYKNTRVLNQLVKAVLENQTASIRNKLLSLSILTEFNLELFAKLCLDQDDQKNKEVLFNEFLATITRSNMFIISLDDNQIWYRFHHMFIDQINEILLGEHSKEQIDALKLSAADWYHKNNFCEEAIEFYLSADQPLKALEVFQEFRLILLSGSRFQLMERLFKQFPQELRDKNGILQVTMGWLFLQTGNIPHMAQHIDPLEQSLLREGYPEELLDLLLGEVHAMKAFDRYLSNVDVQACFEHSEKAIKYLKDQNPYALGIAWVYYGVALQHLGQPMKARKELYKKLENSNSNILQGQILIILVFLDWYEVDLSALHQTSNHLLQLGIDSGIKYLIASGNIMLGVSYYYQNQDERALKYLEAAHELRHHALSHMSFPAGMALANIYVKSGKAAESDAIIKAYEKTALTQGGKLFVKMTKSASADIAWRYRNDLSGLKWATENDYKDFLPMANLYSPELVQARILALDSNPASNNLAQDIIDNTIPFFVDRNDTNILIRSYIIQALLYHKTGHSNNAFETLQIALDLSSVGQFTRPYLELGEAMKDLLLAYKTAKGSTNLVDEILQDHPIEINSAESIQLSLREKEILLLSEKLTNKEIGNQLFIAEKTVKSHITNINKKLNVKSKLEAIVKAKNLELV